MSLAKTYYGRHACALSLLLKPIIIHKVIEYKALHLCLKEGNRESTLRHAEGADLRSALREAESKGAVPEALGSLHTEVAHLRFTLFIFFLPPICCAMLLRWQDLLRIPAAVTELAA